MRILITGHKGFIGQHLFKLLQKEHELYGFDRNEGKNLNLLGNITETFISFKPEIVIHLASNISNDINNCRDDVIAILNLLEFCKEFKVKKFIFTSSAAVYGDSCPKTIPINAYGISKLQCEQWCEYYSELGLNVIILRLSNVYGTNGKGVINQFINRIKNNLPLTIYGDGFQIRDYIHVNDVINIIKQIIKSDITSDVLNVSQNNSTNIWELLGFFYSITQKDLKICFEPNILKEIRISKLDNIDLLISEFLDTNSFRNFISLQKGIEELWNETK